MKSSSSPVLLNTAVFRDKSHLFILLFIFIYLFDCVIVHAGSCFDHVGLGYQTQVVRPHGEYLYLLSYLISSHNI